MLSGRCTLGYGSRNDVACGRWSSPGRFVQISGWTVGSDWWSTPYSSSSGSKPPVATFIALSHAKVYRFFVVQSVTGSWSHEVRAGQYSRETSERVCVHSRAVTRSSSSSSCNNKPC